jgi:hypothetical protein
MPRRKRQRSVIEEGLPSRSVLSCHGESMEVNGSYSITQEGIAVIVETTVNGEKSSDACSGRTFQEVLSELAATNYGPEAFLEALRALPEWDQLEARMKQEELESEERLDQARAAAAEKQRLHEASLGQIVARSADGRFQMGWRRIWHSERAIRVVVTVNGREDSIAELFGAKPTSVTFDERAEEFQGQIVLPTKPGSAGAPAQELKRHRFRVGVQPPKLRSLEVCQSE